VTDRGKDVRKGKVKRGLALRGDALQAGEEKPRPEKGKFKNRETFKRKSPKLNEETRLRGNRKNKWRKSHTWGFTSGERGKVSQSLEVVTRTEKACKALRRI